MSTIQENSEQDIGLDLDIVVERLKLNDLSIDGTGSVAFIEPSYATWIFVIGLSSLLLTGVSIWCVPIEKILFSALLSSWLRFLRDFADIATVPRPGVASAGSGCSAASAAYALATLASINLMVSVIIAVRVKICPPDLAAQTC